MYHLRCSGKSTPRTSYYVRSNVKDTPHAIRTLMSPVRVYFWRVFVEHLRPTASLALSCPAFTNRILAPTPIARLHEMLLDMTNRTLVMVMVNGIGAHLTNDEKRAHLTDLKHDHLIHQVCVREILLPEK